jgi:hypothetical protein
MSFRSLAKSLPAFLLIIAKAADNTPEHRRMAAELVPPGAMEQQVDSALEMMSGDMPADRLAQIRKVLASPAMKQRFEAATARSAARILKDLSNEELAKLHAAKDSKENLGVQRKLLLAMGDAWPVVMDEVGYVANVVSERTKFELEIPWAEIPRRRRDMLEQAAALLLQANGQALPSKADLTKQVDETLKQSGGRREQIQPILDRIAGFDEARLRKAVAESYARRLTTREAEWYLAMLSDPVYRTANAKAAHAMEVAMKEILPE